MTPKYLLTLISLAGLLVSGYLLIGYVTPIPIVCDASGGCETVKASPYSSFFGIPTPAYGVLFYAALGVTVALERYNLVRYLTTVGLIVSIYLSSLEAFVVKAWCLWCVVSAILATLAFIVAWMPRRPRQPQTAQTLTEELAV